MPIERRAGDLMLNGERISTELEGFLEREDARLRELAQKATSPATRRAYASDWDSFCHWCLSRDFVALPAAPDVVARYLRWLIDRPQENIFIMKYESGFAARQNGVLWKSGVRAAGIGAAWLNGSSLCGIGPARFRPGHPGQGRRG